MDVKLLNMAGMACYLQVSFRVKVLALCWWGETVTSESVFHLQSRMEFVDISEIMGFVYNFVEMTCHKSIVRTHCFYMSDALCFVKPPQPDLSQDDLN